MSDARGRLCLSSVVSLHSRAVKIIEDKVAVYPPHALCKKDIEMLLATVPDAWTAELDTVRLSNAPAYDRGCSPPALLHSRTLTICSRGLAKEVAVTEILRELGCKVLGLQRRRFRRFSESDLARLTPLVQPLVDKVVSRLSRKKVWLDR